MPEQTSSVTMNATPAPERQQSVLLIDPAPEVHRMLSMRLREDDIALVAAMGELAEGFRARGLPPGIQCEPFVDQPAVLERADLVVTHGGANSVMEALTAGVPLLLSPLCNDQPHDLAFIERSGAGRGIDLDVASVDEIRGALRELLADGPERAAAARIAASYRAHDGAEGAAALARSAIGTSRGSTAP